MGRDSSVGIANGCGLDGPGIESRWEAIFFAPVQTGPAAHPASCTIGTESFQGVKSGRGVTLTPHPLLVPWSWKSRAIPLLFLWAVRPVQSLSACTRVYFTFTFGHERVELYLYSPMGRTACTEPQCLYKRALYLYRWSWKSRAIPLLPLWAVRPLQSLSACTRVHVTFTFGHERVELYLYSPYGPYGLYRASVPVQGCTLAFTITLLICSISF